MQHADQLYLGTEFPEWEEIGVSAHSSGLIVSMAKGKSQGGVLLPTSGRMTPDIGTVLSVGKHYADFYQPGDKVAVKPGEGLYYYDWNGHDLRFIVDTYDEDGDLTGTVFDYVPLNKDRAIPTWALVERVPKDASMLLLKKEYGDVCRYRGRLMAYDSAVKLTFRNPETWDLTEDHCLIPTVSLLAAL